MTCPRSQKKSTSEQGIAPRSPESQASAPTPTPVFLFCSKLQPLWNLEEGAQVAVGRVWRWQQEASLLAQGWNASFSCSTSVNNSLHKERVSSFKVWTPLMLLASMWYMKDPLCIHSRVTTWLVFDQHGWAFF